jgi:FtsZ-interacting cell division protein ZipA
MDQELFFYLVGVFAIAAILVIGDWHRLNKKARLTNTHEDRRRQETDADRLARWVEADARRRSGMAPPLGTSQAKGFKGEQQIHAAVTQMRRVK